MFKTIITPVFPYFSAVFEAGQKCTLLDIEKSRPINFRSAFLLRILHYFVKFLKAETYPLIKITKEIVVLNPYSIDNDLIDFFHMDFSQFIYLFDYTLINIQYQQCVKS